MSWRLAARRYWDRLPEWARAAAFPPGYPGPHLRILAVAFVVASVVVLAWTCKYALAIHRLTRGVGNTNFYTSDGRAWFPLDEHRRDVPLSQISPHVQHAVVAVEDHRFYSHRGIDPLGLARAVLRNLTPGAPREGGSTITQQLARTLFLSNERSLWRKAREALLASMLERQLNKDQVLELYLNRVPMSGGYYGVEATSRKLFAKKAADLGLAESALLAGLIRAPSALSPWSNLEGALARSDVVLARMQAEGYITEAEERAARRARLRITSSPGQADARSGYAKEFLRQQFRERAGDDHPPDWKVRTTFVPGIQAAAERAVADGLARLGEPELQAALVAVDPHTGDILAMVGGRDFTASPFNRAVRSRRQPGSAFKPFVYAVALQRGLSPVSVLTDLRSVTAPGRQEWTPRNSGDDSPESATLREALLESNNQAAVSLQMKVGTGSVRSLASDLGMAELPDVPSLALGTGLVTPLELTAAFAVFPGGGVAVRPRGIVQILDADGAVVAADEVQKRRVLSAEAAYQALSMLRDVVDLGTASSARSMGLRIPAGGKTGTTSDFKDAWFVGFSSSMVAGVWVGFDQPEPIGRNAYAARVALPIWTDFMRRAAGLRPAADFEPPAGLRPFELCRMSYMKPVEDCPTYIEYFKEGDDVPGRMCPLHEGSLKQEVRRVLDDALSRLGRKILDIFD
jgi:1A family penicillin-binding protein